MILYDGDITSPHDMTFLITSDIGPEFAFNAQDAIEAREIVNHWAAKHSRCGSSYNIEDITGMQTNLLHNEYVR